MLCGASRGIAAFGFIFCLVGIEAGPAAAACQQWRVPKQYTINQHKDKFMSAIVFVVSLRLTQNGSALSGAGEYYPVVLASSGVRRGALGGQGPAEGFIRGNQFQVTMRWSSSSAGVYTGTIDRDGHIVGSTFDLKHPGSKAAWHSAVPLAC
jgi:hypothetical protein